MAARLEPAPRAPSPSLVDLRHLRSEDLDPLLDEEVEAWRELLDWDFAKSADLVRRFVDMRALSGFALVDRRRGRRLCLLRPGGAQRPDRRSFRAGGVYQHRRTRTGCWSRFWKP